MMRNKKLYAAGLLVLLPCLAAIPEVDKNKTLGNPAAPVRIEIFGDFTCIHCKALHETILPQLMKDYVVTGKVYIVDRAFPLQGHQYTREAFAFAVAAARVGKYQQVADVLFAQQSTWATNGNVWGTVASVLSPTEQKRVQELSKDPGVLAEIEAEYQEGVASGVNETPTMIVTAGGKRLPLPNSPDYRFLKSMIDGFIPK
jgi:protein-disulfide isomerase